MCTFFKARYGKDLRANTRFELCAGKKIYIPNKKQYDVIPNFPDEGKFHFVEIKTGIKEDEKWILGGEDSCHVCTTVLAKRNITSTVL